MSERDSSGVIISSLPEGTAEVVLTGDRPTGQLHLGHYYGSLRRRVECQERFKQYILIADAQALTDHAQNPGLVQRNVLEVLLDYLAVGIDPGKSTIYLQSAIPETAELTFYYLNLVGVGRLMRNPTVKTEMKQKGFGDEVPVGFLCYPINQAADITQFRATLVPAGADQVPMIELTNDIARSFNRIYQSDYFVEAKALIPAGGLLPGTDGNSKMSKSLGNAIYLADDSDTVMKKVRAMFTDPKHLRIEDPGTVEGNTVFTYLDAFDPAVEEVEELKAHYRKGGLGDGVVKKRLTEVLNTFLAPIRERREHYASDKAEVIRILKDGTDRARQTAAQTLAHVKGKLGMTLFS